MKRLLPCLMFVLLLVSPISQIDGWQGWVKQEQNIPHDEISLVNQDEMVVYHAVGNIFKGSFNEPFESMIFITWRGTVCKYTNQMARQVFLPLVIVQLDLMDNGEGFKDVILVVHNHWGNAIFSPADRVYYNRLKQEGFRGVFALWDSARNEMVNRLPIQQ